MRKIQVITCICVLLGMSALRAAAESPSIESLRLQPSSCSGGISSNVAIAKVVVREFNRTPEFSAKSWNDIVPATAQGAFLSANFNCLGRSEIVFLRDNAIISSLRLDRSRAPEQRDIGRLPARVRWENVRVSKLCGDHCDFLLAPGDDSKELLIGEICNAEQLTWRSVPLPGSLSPIAEFRLIEDEANGTLFFFGIGIAGSLLYSGQTAGLGEIRIDAQPLQLEGWEYVDLIADRNHTVKPLVHHPLYPHWMLLDEHGERRAFASAQYASRFLRAVALDINGDGRSEVLLPADALHGPWLVLPYGKAALEMPQRSLSRLLGNRSPSATGDFDGDGLDDVFLVRDRDISVLFAEPGRPVAGAKLRQRGTLYSTGPNGIAEIPLSPGIDLDVALLEETDVLFSERLHRRRDHALSKPSVFLVDRQRKEPRSASLRANELESDYPAVCVGFAANAKEDHWGRQGECPAGYIFMEQDDGALPSGTCCPLPARDILLDKHQWTTDHCPDNHVVTALAWEPGREPGTCAGCRQKIRCTALDTGKYKLEKPSPGLLYGDESSISIEGADLSKTDAPVGLRFGLGRTDLAAADSDGCVGQPWGAVLVGRWGRKCGQMEFARILRRTTQAGAGAFEPVIMFPNCRSLVDIYDPSEGCTEQKSP